MVTWQQVELYFKNHKDYAIFYEKWLIIIVKRRWTSGKMTQRVDVDAKYCHPHSIMPQEILNKIHRKFGVTSQMILAES